jgi:Replication-relaxation
MVRAERNQYRARASAIDERDVQVLLLLLEQKVLTTHQLTSLCFRSLRRCQHRMRELKDLGLISSFQVGRGFGEGRAPACWYLTKHGLAEIADAKDVRTSDLPWIPDQSYRSSKVLAHRLGVNAFFCALAEASRTFLGHCLATWRPEHSVRTRAAEVKPDGFGRYLHTGGACEFYLEYDRATEASRALSRKLEGYLKLAAGWMREQELTGFPNLLVLVPEEEREGEVATAFRSAVGSLHVSSSLASSFPLYVASEDRLTELGVLGAVWRHVPTDGDRLSLVDLPARSRDLYRTTGCLGRYFTDADPGHGRRISPRPQHPDSAPCRPDMHLEAAARGRANRPRTPPPAREERRGRGTGTRAAAGRARRQPGAGVDRGRC